MIKKKHIKQSLHEKLYRWLESIDDVKVRKTAAKNVIVTGGAIVSMLTGDEINDYDLYFKTKKSAREVATYYMNKFFKAHGDGMPSDDMWDVNSEYDRIYTGGNGVIKLEDEEVRDYLKLKPEDPIKGVYFPVCVSGTAITLTDRVQLIIRFTGAVEEIHKNFDFLHVTSSYDYKNKELIIPPDAALSILAKELVFMDSKYPLASMFRVRKMLKRGFTISAGQILKIALRLQDFDLTNPDVLAEQLVGVDIQYFNEFVSSINSAKLEGKKIDKTYLYKLIDEHF